ncbi:hypothetical protein ACS0TY_002562 [Phlomoides rotata]
MKHARTCNVIEKSFSVLKKLWVIPRSASFYPIRVQNCIILTYNLRSMLNLNTPRSMRTGL